MNMFEALHRREDYEREMRRENPLPGQVDAFVRYNLAYLIRIVSWMVWMGFIMGWSIVVTSNIVDEGQRWGFARAQYFAIISILLVGRLPVPTPRLTGVGLPPRGRVHDGVCAPHGPCRVMCCHNDVAGSEVLQSPRCGVGAGMGHRDDGCV